MKEIKKLFFLAMFIVLGAICLKLIKDFYLPLDAAIKTILFMVGAVVVGGSTLHSYLINRHQYFTILGGPIAFMLFVDIFFPWLKYKAELESIYSDVPFWGTDWFQVSVNLVILIVGYGMIYNLRKR
ncbi:hypothetical protein [Photobacterium leiognathi]|uniref:hypothetical protein n=1 Tax=Photobacterium leiognathi TaxID=553611 RepID=UPI0029816014|nr:hypothetical protein [Photobacterium leiognathi]